MPETKTPRAAARKRREQDILDAGRRQLAERGAAGLSLREVARELGLVSSAVYRYVSSRDELLTLLLTDAYTRLADAVDDALRGRGDAADTAPVHTIARAMRTWALENRAEWGLIYGAPVPGYVAPTEATTPPGTRVMKRLVLELEKAPFREVSSGPVIDEFAAAGMSALGVTPSSRVGVVAIQLWCAVIGTISMELFGQLGPELTGRAGEELLDATVTGFFDS